MYAEFRVFTDFGAAREELNNSVEAMARFVYNNQEWLLLNGELKPKKTIWA